VYRGETVPKATAPISIKLKIAIERSFLQQARNE